MKQEIDCRGHNIQTPWGVADWCVNYADGIDSFCTPGHGGFRLSAVRRMQMPAPVREIAAKFVLENGHKFTQCGGGTDGNGWRISARTVNGSRECEFWFPEVPSLPSPFTYREAIAAGGQDRTKQPVAEAEVRQARRVIDRVQEQQIDDQIVYGGDMADAF